MNTWFRSALFAGAALAVLGLAPQAFAQASCEFEVGAAFGFCTAYCEAMDCDSANPQASPKACAKVLAKWDEQTGLPIPCEVVVTTPQICPVEAADVTTICATLPAGTDYFFVEAKGPSTSDDSPGICTCSTTVTECDPELPAGTEGTCATTDAEPFQGFDATSMASSGPGTCDTVCKTIGGTRRCFNLCFEF